MFTGIIEEIGKLRIARKLGGGLVLDVEAPVVSEGIALGESIAVNGVCLTVKERDGKSFHADVAPETRRRTYLDRLRPGAPLNLERSLRAGDRMGGHIVQVHVDGVGEIVSLRAEVTGKTMLLRHPPGLDRFFVEKGSVAIDGASLTIAAVGNGRISVALVPVTLENTILGSKRPGDPLHVEVDVIGKYVERMVRRREGRSLEEYLENDHE